VDRWADFEWEVPEGDSKLPSRPLRFLRGGNGTVEITTRTIHGRYLLKPSRKSVEIIEGVLGRALDRSPDVELHGYWFLSNHFNLILTVPSVELMSQFMCFVNSNLARELGALHGWREKFWGRRYRAIEILDGISMVKRLAYLLAQGTKEGLVARPSEWPGANCLSGLTMGVVREGVWFDRTREFRARKRGERPTSYRYSSLFTVPLTPLPCWKDLSVSDRQAKVLELVQDIERRAAEDNREKRRRPMGAKAILAQDPHDHPDRIAKSPAPFCHGTRKLERAVYVDLYFEFLRVYQDASARFRTGELTAAHDFPPGCFPPRGRFISPRRRSQPTRPRLNA
jgi:hypothetical protein